MNQLFRLLLLCTCSTYAQGNFSDYSVEMSYFRGNILRHSGYISHLITNHPQGALISFNHRTFGNEEWEQAYNYPDYGLSFQYQDFKNQYLGEAYAIGLHYNFFFLNRHLRFRISQGIGYATNPYDPVANYKNNAFGSRLLSSNLFLLDYKKENLIGGLGIQAGLMFTHFSNGRIKSPNSGINTYAASIGLNYNMDSKPQIYIPADSTVVANYKEPIRYSLYFRTGISESQVPDSGQHPFYHISMAADKRIGRKSAIQLGVDVFFSMYLKEYIRYVSIAYPEKPPVDGNTDYKRIGVLAGHELFVNRLSIETQVGIYVYRPFNYESSVYQRVGFKYYITKQLFTGLALKAHGGRAEAIELGIGARL